MNEGKVYLLAGLLLLAVVGFRRESNAAANDEKSGKFEASYWLSSTQMELVQPIREELSEPEKQKFVQIELGKVFNPDKKPIIFEVYFLTENRKKILLGTFSPYPADKVGTFIVPTNHQLKKNGAIVVGMQLPDGNDAKINVQVRHLTFPPGGEGPKKSK